MGKLVLYSSGLGRSITDFLGVADAGHPVCLTMSDLAHSVRRAALDFNERGGLLLVDSGAYSVATGAKTGIDFVQVMQDYQNFAQQFAHPENLMLVAPDVLGDMQATAALQWEYLPQMRQIAEQGVNWLVPFQKGWDDYGRYEAHAQLLSFSLPRYVLGVPMKRNPWAPQELARLVTRTQPQQLHLLGLGLRRKQLVDVLGTLWGVLPDLPISHDATRIRAAVGEGRPITQGVKQQTLGHIQSRFLNLGLDGLARFYEKDLGYVAELGPEDYRGLIEKFQKFAQRAQVLRLEYDEDWDETEDVFDIFNTPGWFTPEEGWALGEAFGVRDPQHLIEWAKASQLPSDLAIRQQYEDRYRVCLEDCSYGCALGFLIEIHDFSGRLLRSPHLLVRQAQYHLNHAQKAQQLDGLMEEATSKTPEFRRRAVETLAKTDLAQQSRISVQIAFGF